MQDYREIGNTPTQKISTSKMMTTRGNKGKRQTRADGVSTNGQDLRPPKRRTTKIAPNTGIRNVNREKISEGVSQDRANRILVDTPEFVGQELLEGTDRSNRQVENASACEQISALTSITDKESNQSRVGSIPTVLNRFSNEVIHNWKSHEESLRKVLKMRVSSEYFPRFKFCNKKICNHIILTCIRRNEISTTKGMKLTEFLDVTSRAIVFQLFNDGRHAVQSNMRREYRSK